MSEVHRPLQQSAERIERLAGQAIDFSGAQRDLGLRSGVGLCGGREQTVERYREARPAAGPPGRRCKDAHGRSSFALPHIIFGAALVICGQTLWRRC